MFQSLIKPSLPKTEPRPEPIPKPDLPQKPTLTPEPRSIPKPILPSKPTIRIRKPIFLLLAVGLVLLISAYTFTLTAFGMLIDTSEIAASAFSGFVAFLAGLLSALAISIGLLRKKEIPYSDQKIEELDQKFSDSKIKLTSIVLPIFLFFISGVCLFITLIGGLFNEPFVTALLVLALGFIPAVIGLFLLGITLASVKIKEKNLYSLRQFNSELHEWEQEKLKVINEWDEQNNKIFEDWKKAHQKLIINWEDEKKKILDEWKNSNKLLINKWEEQNTAILKKYARAINRWENLYFCHRDDIVYVPSEGTFSNVEEIWDYLYN